MTFIVTLNPDTDGAVSREVSDTEIDGTVRRMVEHLRQGEAVQVRRADYLDTKTSDDVLLGTSTGKTYGHLRVVQ